MPLLSQKDQSHQNEADTTCLEKKNSVMLHGLLKKLDEANTEEKRLWESIPKLVQHLHHQSDMTTEEVENHLDQTLILKILAIWATRDAIRSELGAVVASMISKKPRHIKDQAHHGNYKDTNEALEDALEDVNELVALAKEMEEYRKPAEEE